MNLPLESENSITYAHIRLDKGKIAITCNDPKYTPITVGNEPSKACIKIFDEPTKKCILRFDFDPSQNHHRKILAFNPDCTRVALYLKKDDTFQVEIIDLSGKLITTCKITTDIYQSIPEWSLDGNYLALTWTTEGLSGCCINIFDTKNGELKYMSCDAEICCLSWHPSGKSIATSYSWSPKINIWKFDASYSDKIKKLSLAQLLSLKAGKSTSPFAKGIPAELWEYRKEAEEDDEEEEVTE